MKTLKRLVAFLLLAGIALCAAGYSLLKGKEFTLTIEKEQIQAAIDQKMPFEKTLAKVFTLTVKNARVLLEEGSDRIGASTDFEVSARVLPLPKNPGGSVTARTGLRYDPSSSRFFLVDPDIENLRFERIPEKYTQAVSEGSREIIRNFINEIPVYTIQDKDLKLKLARAVLKKVEVKGGRVAITLGY